MSKRADARVTLLRFPIDLIIDTSSYEVLYAVGTYSFGHDGHRAKLLSPAVHVFPIWLYEEGAHNTPN